MTDNSHTYFETVLNYLADTSKAYRRSLKNIYIKKPFPSELSYFYLGIIARDVKDNNKTLLL